MLTMAGATARRGLTVPAAASYAGTSHWFIRSAVWSGRLKAKRAGKTLIILREELGQFLSWLPDAEPLNSTWLARRQQREKA